MVTIDENMTERIIQEYEGEVKQSTATDVKKIVDRSTPSEEYQTINFDETAKNLLCQSYQERRNQ